MMKRHRVLHSEISVGDYEDFLREIFFLAQYKVPSYICFANVHMVMEGYRDNAFQKIMNEAAVVAPDGRPVSLFISYFYNKKQPRVCGMDIFPDLLKNAADSGKSIYFYGNTPEILDIILDKATREFPNLKIAGSYSPPFRILSASENAVILSEIKKTNPDLIFVSLGCPKQEKWMAENKDVLGTCLLGVGQAFNTYAGVEKRLPGWMRNLSLEWTYRLYSEPRRLWKRYLITNSYFLLLTLKCLLMIWRKHLLFFKTDSEPTKISVHKSDRGLYE